MPKNDNLVDRKNGMANARAQLKKRPLFVFVSFDLEAFNTHTINLFNSCLKP